MKLKQKVKSNIKLLSWQLKNPGKPFYSFYINHVNETLNKNISHPTLGTNHKDVVRFEKTAKIEKDFLIGNGLKPTHTFVDYGCGSLRLGKELIPYLDSEKYHGLDVTDKFFLLGKELINSELWTEKKPFLRVINDQSLNEIKNYGVDYLMSCAVLYHIPIGELREYFTNILMLLKIDGKAFIDFTHGSKISKRAIATWNYPKNVVKKIASEASGDVKFHQLSGEESKWYPQNHMIMELTHAKV